MIHFLAFRKVVALRLDTLHSTFCGGHRSWTCNCCYLAFNLTDFLESWDFPIWLASIFAGANVITSQRNWDLYPLCQAGSIEPWVGQVTRNCSKAVFLLRRLRRLLLHESAIISLDFGWRVSPPYGSIVYAWIGDSMSFKFGVVSLCSGFKVFFLRSKSGSSVYYSVRYY